MLGLLKRQPVTQVQDQVGGINLFHDVEMTQVTIFYLEWQILVQERHRVFGYL